MRIGHGEQKDYLGVVECEPLRPESLGIRRLIRARQVVRGLLDSVALGRLRSVWSVKSRGADQRADLRA
jgi:hypothetical protein